MSNSLHQLLECLDSENCDAVNNTIMHSLGIQANAIPFLKLATTPSHTTCPGCEEHCHSMPVLKNSGEVVIWCDKPRNYGKIKLSKEDLESWRLDLSILAELLVTQLSLKNRTCIFPDRIYDLGILEVRAVMLMRGPNWPDAQDLYKDKRICNTNPFFITLSQPPESLPFPAIWVGQLLHIDYSGRVTVDKDRLYTALGGRNITAGNIFQKRGDVWLVRFNGKETYIKHSNGMLYIQHLLQSPNKEIPAITLQAIINKPPAPGSVDAESNFDDMSVPGDDMLIDEQTRREVMNKIQALKSADPTSSDITTLENYLGGATHKGKRKTFVDDNDRARVAVNKAINSVKTKLKKELPELYSHFEGCLKTGALCKYTRLESIKW